MVFAVLEFSDFAILAAIVFIAGGSWSAAKSQAGFGAPNRDRLLRVEQKLDLLLKQLGIEFAAPPKSNWQTLVDEDQGNKIAAIKAYREEVGGGLAEAKQAVENYMEGRQ